MKKFFLLTCIVALSTGSKVFSQTIYSAPTYHQFNTNYGYLQIGPQNSDWAHIYTDRPAVIFNKPVYSYSGCFSAYYTNDLQLQTNGSTWLTIKQASGDAYFSGSIKMAPLKNIVFNIDQVDQPRLWIGHSGVHAYIDYMDNLNFRANKNWISALTLYGDGSVGVGFSTTYNQGDYRTHGYKFAVNGGIICEEITVETDVPDADYVFNSDYDLKPLSKLENYIKKQKHLPDIPSAEEFKKNGYKVGKMDEMLLRKVEELTLYIIEQQKTINNLSNELKTIKNDK